MPTKWLNLLSKETLIRLNFLSQTFQTEYQVKSQVSLADTAMSKQYFLVIASFALKGLSDSRYG